MLTSCKATRPCSQLSKGINRDAAALATAAKANIGEEGFIGNNVPVVYVVKVRRNGLSEEIRHDKSPDEARSYSKLSLHVSSRCWIINHAHEHMNGVWSASMPSYRRESHTSTSKVGRTVYRLNVTRYGQ
jgi:hypothetical protein